MSTEKMELMMTYPCNKKFLPDMNGYTGWVLNVPLHIVDVSWMNKNQTKF